MNGNRNMRLIGVWMLLSSLCGCIDLGGPSDSPATGTISGTVIDSRTGQTLGAVSIGTDPASRTSVTDADGRFTLPGCPVGRYSLRAEKPGYSPSVKDLFVGAGAAVDAGISLLSATGSLGGKVLAHTGGLALAGALVKTIPATMSVVTDANGDYGLEDLVPMTYEVIVERSGFAAASATVVVNAGKRSIAAVQMAAVDSAAFRQSVPPRAGVELAQPSAQGPATSIVGAFPEWSLVLATDPSGLRLSGLAAIDDAHAWACGYEARLGVILRFDPHFGWIRESLPDGIESVGSIQMVSAIQGFASAFLSVGTGFFFVILKYDGVSWKVLRSLNYPFHVGAGEIHVLSEEMIFAAFGDRGDQYAVTPQGWTNQGIKGEHAAFRGNGEGFLVGLDSQGWRFDGLGWRVWETSLKFKQISVSRSGKLFGIAQGLEVDTLVFYGSGNQRRGAIPLDVLRPFETVTSLSVVDDTHVWIATSKGAVLFYDGSGLVRNVVMGAAGFALICMHNVGGGFALAGNGIYRFH